MATKEICFQLCLSFKSVQPACFSLQLYGPSESYLLSGSGLECSSSASTNTKKKNLSTDPGLNTLSELEQQKKKSKG